VLVFDRSKVI